MTESDSLNAYQEYLSLLDRALESATGIRISIPTEAEGHYLRHRLHRTRLLDRQRSERIYPMDSPDFGTSMYDQLKIRAPIFEDGRWWLHIVHREVLGIIEELPGAAE